MAAMSPPSLPRRTLMLGGSQFRAYRTIMKTPRHLPRQSQADAALFRVIALGAVLVIGLVLVAMVAMEIADIDYAGDGVVVAVIPAALTFLFFWWLVDTWPIFSRQVIATLAFLTGAACVVLTFLLPFWDQLQSALLALYATAVSRVAWRQIRAIKAEQALSAANPNRPMAEK
jgi:hypothetical protein